MKTELTSVRDDLQPKTAPTGWGGIATDPATHALLRAHAHTYAAKTVIRLEGDDSPDVLWVLSGWLCLSKSLPDGQRQIIDFALPGDIISPSSADEATTATQIEAVTDVTLSATPLGAWRKHMLGKPDLETRTRRSVTAFAARMAERVLRLGQCSAEERVAYALLEFCVRLNAIGESRACAYHIPLTQQQVGEFVGLSAVHVCRTMRRMERNGILQADDPMDIRITNVQGLFDLAGTDFETLAHEILA